MQISSGIKLHIPAPHGGDDVAVVTYTKVDPPFRSLVVWQDGSIASVSTALPSP